MKKPWMRWRTALKALLALLLIVMLLRWFEHRLVYYPGRTMDATGAELGRPFEDVVFKAGDGVELSGWFFPGNSNSPRAQFVVLVLHGNAGNISHRVDLCRALLEAGVSVFALEYRGYGRSKGRPGEEGTYLDAQAAHQWLRQKGFLGKDIIAYGESLGGGVASELCLREETGGLVLQSTFTSIPDIGKELYPWLPVRWMSTIKYDTRARLPHIQVPVLVMHSRTDDLIGFHHAERNFAAANEPKFFCELPGVHNDPGWESPAFREGIEKLLLELESRSP
jgi:fermentation-respiration switch protein FrsA (DUF1100 family)